MSEWTNSKASLQLDLFLEHKLMQATVSILVLHQAPYSLSRSASSEKRIDVVMLRRLPEPGGGRAFLRVLGRMSRSKPASSPAASVPYWCDRACVSAVTWASVGSEEVAERNRLCLAHLPASVTRRALRIRTLPKKHKSTGEAFFTKASSSS
jgi:hypothetical protein